MPAAATTPPSPRYSRAFNSGSYSSVSYIGTGTLNFSSGIITPINTLRAARQSEAAIRDEIAMVTKVISDNLQAFLHGVSDPVMRTQIAAALPGVGARLAAVNVSDGSSEA